MPRISLNTLLAGVAFFLAAPVAHANIIANPSFEIDNYTTYAGFNGSGPNVTYIGNNGLGFSRPGTITGWNIGNSVDIYSGTGYTQTAGNSYMDIVGGGVYSANAFFISQVLSTTPGQVYSLTFDYGENGSLKAGATVVLDVSLTSNGGSGLTDFSQAFSWSLSSNATSNPNWRTASVFFTASSSQTELKLRDLSNVRAGFGGPTYTIAGAVVDNFSVESMPIPEPGSLALFSIGLALVLGATSVKRSRVR